MTTAMEPRERLLIALTDDMAAEEATLLLIAYEATFACELYSETWKGCPEGTQDEEYADTQWCRTCLARQLVERHAK